jgi:hypothetical protein
MDRRNRLLTALALVLGALAALASGAVASTGGNDDLHWGPLTKQTLGPGDVRYFNMSYSDAWAGDALRQLGATPPGPGATRGDYAKAVYQVLQDKVPATSRSVARAEPPVPDWLVAGYMKYEPATVAKSRWLNDVVAGLNGQAQVNPKVKPDADLAALYAYWCIYDAEWFNAARKPDYKAWLTALQLTYPADWQRLDGESKEQLHSRLAVPLQTKDEPYREIDNWATALKNNHGDFAKPLVRRSLVAELLQRGGVSIPGPDGQPQPVDQRLFQDPAYKGAVPAGLGLSDQDFFVLAALCVEFSGELNTLSPRLQQLKPFAQYFIDAFEREK